MNDKPNWKVAHLDDIERRDRDLPVREHLGIHAFGINAFTPGEDGLSPRWAGGPLGPPAFRRAPPYSLATSVCRDEQWPRLGCLEEGGDEHGRLRPGVESGVDVTVARVNERLSSRVRPFVATARRDVGE